MRPREPTYDSQTLESLKHRVRSLDERKLSLHAELRTARTDQLLLRQEVQQMRTSIAETIKQEGSVDSNAKLNAAEERMNSLNREAASFRSEIDTLVKRIDKAREISRNAEIELEMFRLRFAKTISHASGEVFLSMRSQLAVALNQPQVPPVPRVRPLSGRRPLSAFDASGDAPEDFNVRVGVHGLAKTVGRAVGRWLLRWRASEMTTKKENALNNIGQGEIVYRGDEISAFREFLAKRGGFVELFQRGNSNTENFTVAEFSEIIATTGYPGNPRTLSACLATGNVIWRSKLVKSMNLDDPRLRPLANFNFKLEESSALEGALSHGHNQSQSRTAEVIRRHQAGSQVGGRAKTAPTPKRPSSRSVMHHHVHVVLPNEGLNDSQLKRVLAEISKSLSSNLHVHN